MQVLKNILAQEDTVLFIGSGVSIWSGLPSWEAMISNLSDFLERNGVSSDLVRSEATNGDLLQAASYGFDSLTEQQIGEFIRESCKYGSAEPAPIHEKIVTLGPTCFVTTNYDNLIEESVRKWLPHKFFRPPVTNRHLTETAGIVHARAIDFIFKPHGDAADTESIILTREQYRKLLPGGERHAALETVKMLLASRPVVYIGFGLRDPDFIYLRDLLANTYKGGTRDHYAIMADVAPEEVSYWKKNYGIVLIDYKTIEAEQGRKNHSNLLVLLDDLKEANSAKSEIDIHRATEELQDFLPQNVLSLARHAGRLSTFSSVIPELTIRAKRIENCKSGEKSIKRDRYAFQYYEIGDLLEDLSLNRSIILGLPGAGKTYSMKKSAANLADKLHEVCLDENFRPENVLIPIYVDLKLYEGDVKELVSKSLASSLNFDDLDNRFKIRIYLDSFNEIPKEFIENGSYEKDIFVFLDGLKNCEVVIGSRTIDGLSRLNYPVYSLEDIDYKYVEKEADKIGVTFDKRFKREVLSMLQKPFFFNLFINRKVDLPEMFNPIDLYESYFRNIEGQFFDKYGFNFELKCCLSKVAYEALNNGVEAQPLQVLLSLIKIQISKQSIDGINEQEIANWLVSIDLLIPYVNNKFAFFHQSITEYLAAIELARKYQKNSDVLRDILTHQRWDQALFFTLPLLPEEQSNNFINHIVNIDLKLAIRASKYIETDRAPVVTKLLERVIDKHKKYGVEHDGIDFCIVDNLLVEEQHSNLLFEIAEFKNSIGGAACVLLDRIKGESLKDYLFNLFLIDRHDFNFLNNNVSVILKKYINKNDVSRIQDLINEVSNSYSELKDNNSLDGFVNGVSNLLVDLDLKYVKQELFTARKDNLPKLNSRILCSLIYYQVSNESLELCVDLLPYESHTPVSIYFIGRFGSEEAEKLDWDMFGEEQLEQLIRYTSNERSWSVRAIEQIASRSESFKRLVEKKSNELGGLLANILKYLISKDSDAFVDNLSSLSKLSMQSLSQEPLHLIDEVDIDWNGRETTLMDILSAGHIGLSRSILNQTRDKSFGEIKIDRVDVWLDMFADYKTDQEVYWFCYLMAKVFSEHLSKSNIRLFIDEFNSPDSKYRNVLSDLILVEIDDLSTDDFSENVISYLLSKLSKEKIRGHWDSNLIANTCSKRFVNEYLLPLLSIDDQPLANNLRLVLLTAGSRHGKRYISS